MKVIVVMSTYNGEKYLRKQLDSIFAQKGVEVVCFVRDDGSSDGTASILEEYHGRFNLTYVLGENVGWEHSFMLALRDAPHGDYYAFADQDDIWFDNKLKDAIDMLSQYKQEDVIMYHGNKISTDENLKPYPHQVKRIPRPLNRRNAFVQEYAQGCSIVLNNAARDMVLRQIPQEKIAHDFWCGFVCYMTGSVVYDNRPHFYHITHGQNASGEGHMLNSWKGRFKMMISNKGSVYYLPLIFVNGGGMESTSKNKMWCLYECCNATSIV